MSAPGQFIFGQHESCVSRLVAHFTEQQLAGDGGPPADPALIGDYDLAWMATVELRDGLTSIRGAGIALLPSQHYHQDSPDADSLHLPRNPTRHSLDPTNPG